MFNFSFRNKKLVKDLAREIASETSKEIKANEDSRQRELEDIRMALTSIVDKIENLETKLLTKELKDRQSYGHLHYKISELSTDLSSKK